MTDQDKMTGLVNGGAGIQVQVSNHLGPLFFSSPGFLDSLSLPRL